MKILIIDDERSIRNSLKEILGDEGYEVDVAEDGMAALSMVDKEKHWRMRDWIRMIMTLTRPQRKRSY